MAEILANFARSTLASPMSSGDATLTVAAGTGSLFPAAGNFRVTVESEVMLCTSRSTDVLTVTRAQEGTSAVSHGQGLSVVHALTAGGLLQFLREDTPLVTSLPGSPVDGDEVILTDSLSAGTYSWRLKYVAARSTNKWVYNGGAPGFVETATAETTSTTSYANLSGGATGPSFALPVAGDYLVEIGAGITNANDTVTDWMSYDIGVTGANDNDGIRRTGAGGPQAQFGQFALARKKAGLTAVTLTAKYKTSGGTATFSKRWMRVTPVAVGG